MEYLNHGSRKEEFTDVAFYTTDSLPVIYMEARALSLYGLEKLKQAKQMQVQTYGVAGGGAMKRKDDHLRLINYYKIEFPPIQRELNIQYHRETLHYFIKDLIWYGVFKNGKFNEEGAEKLIAKWEGKKIDYLPDNMLSSGVHMGYLQNDFWKKKDILLRERYKIDYDQKKIFLNDSLLATYTLNELPETYTGGLASSYITHYYIVNKEGKMLSDICSNQYTSFATLTFYTEGRPNYISFPLVDKCEQKQIAVSLDFLIQIGKL